MPQIRFRPGLRPGPRWGSSRRSPRPPSRLGRGIPPPHSPPPRRLWRLDLGVPNFISPKLATLQETLDLWLPGWILQTKHLSTAICSCHTLLHSYNFYTRVPKFGTFRISVRKSFSRILRSTCVYSNVEFISNNTDAVSWH